MSKNRPAEKKATRRRARDPLQVNLRWVVVLILATVVIPTVVLAGIGIAVLVSRRESVDLVFGVLVIIFAASVIAGAVLLIVLTGRGARLARIQETFLSQMGHELLTPLAGIKLHVQILEGLALDASARRSVKAMRRELDRLQALVQRTLRWREIRSSRHLYRKTWTSAAEITARVLSQVREEERLTVRQLEGEAWLKGDADALAEAVSNLLQNAFKYAVGSAPIELSVRKLGPLLLFVVSDRGPGLPADEEVEHLFDAFHRVVPAEHPDPGGSGLGLAIVRQIARAHRGGVSAVNRRGGGARFFIHVPLEERP